MTVKKLLALSLVFVMAFSMAACGGNDADTTTLPADETTEAVSTESTTLTDETTDAVAESTEAETEASSDTATEETTEADEFDLKTTEGVVNFYKEAAAKTEKAGVTSNTVMSLTSLDGGEGFIGGIISAFEPIARNALAKNSTPTEGIVGSYEKLLASDVKSATAVDNGKTTTVTIAIKNQTDGVKGNPDGSVAHGVGVLNGVDVAIGELKGVEIDYSQGSIKLGYANATIKVTIDNATGKITSGTWHYTVNVSLDNIKVKIGIISVTLKGAKGVVDYNITL